MIRAIIFAVFVVPIISLVLDKTQKATKKEKFTNTVFVSHAYQTVCHICSLIMVGIAIALGLFMGFDNTVGHSVVFAIFVLLIEFCAWALKRHKVVIDGNNLRITPAVGRTREISFNDISRCTEKEQIGLKIFVGNKKICTVSCDCVGYKEFLATVYKGNIIKNLIMDCQSYTKYRPNETMGGIFVSWRRKEELPTGA